MTLQKKNTFKVKFVIALLIALLLSCGFPTSFNVAHASGSVLPIVVDINRFDSTNVGGDGASTLLWSKGNATATGGLLRLASALNSQNGTAVRRNRIKLTGGFSTYFMFNMGGSTSGTPADGLCFIIYKTDSNTPLVGRYGGGLGYGGINNSIGVEFDSYYNYGYDGVMNFSDPPNKHVAICLNGDNDHSASTTGDTYTSYSENNNIYGNDIHVWVDYDDSNVLTVTYGLSATRSDPSNTTISRNVGDFLRNQEVFVGFSASTGGCNANHDIKKWFFDNSYVSGGLNPSGPYTQAASTIGITLNPDATSPDSASIRLNDATGAAMLNQDFEIFLDGSSQGTFNTGATGVTVYSIPGSLAKGSHTLKVVASVGGALNSKDFDIPYIIRYDAGAHGGFSGLSTEEVLVGHCPAAVPNISPSTGYDFSGWSSDGGTTLLTKAQLQSTTANADLTYVAYYTRKSFAISYNPGTYGSFSGSSSESVLYGDYPLSVPDIIPDTGYDFSGWSSDGGTTLLTKTQVLSSPVTAGATYTAYYTRKSYTVNYDAGAYGSFSGSSSESVLYGDHPLSVPDIIPETGYDFSGWSSDGGTTILTTADVQASSITAGITYTACYTKKSYTVAYDPGLHGNLIGASSESVFYLDKPVSVPGIAADEYYLFDGWISSEDSAVLTTAQVKYASVTKNITYTAQYTRIIYTISPITDQVFAPLTNGYAFNSQEKKAITITRTGNGVLNNLSVVLNGANPHAFTLSNPAETVLNEKTPDTSFTVKARDGLPEGTYAAIVTISADKMDSVTFTVTQTVNPSKSPKRSVTFVVSDGEKTISGASLSVNGQTQTTDSGGKCVFNLSDGIYTYFICNAGFTDSTGYTVITSDTSLITLEIAVSGKTVLYDNDNSTDAVIIANGSEIPSQAILIVDNIPPDTWDEHAVENAYNNQYHIKAMFDAYMLLNSQRIQPNGSVTLGIPIPQNLQNIDTLTIIRINDDGTITKFSPKRIGNMLFITVNHFSRYAILARNEDNPKTGNDSIPIIWWVSLAFLVVALAVLGFILAKRIRAKRLV